MPELIDAVKSIFGAQAEARHIDFQVEEREVDDRAIRGDALRVKQVLANLLSNAMKFTPENGTVRLAVSNMGAIGSTVHYKFVVSDTGPGMTAEYLTHIFTPFEQENEGIAQKFGGSGLGLSITRNLVDLMHGSIDVSSTVGAGSIFTVTLGFAQTEAGAMRSPTASQPSTEAGDFSGYRVLIVEDNEINREISIALFERLGLTVETAPDGDVAVELFSKSAPGYYDAIFMDVRMPHMNGYDATRAIRRSNHPDAQRIPIIAMTANAFAEDVSDALACGMNGHLAKPITPESITEKLQQHLAPASKHIIVPPSENAPDARGASSITDGDDNLTTRS